MAETDWRKIADERLALLAEVARIGAEPPDAVLAIIQGGIKESPRVKGTGWHYSMDDFRRDLTSAADHWREVAGQYRQKAHGETPPAEVARADRDAYAGCLMACSYSYTLAAILRVAADDFGPETARRLAAVADDILTNGDDSDLNADVKPGAPLPPPTPRELENAGQLRLDGSNDPDKVPA